MATTKTSAAIERVRAIAEELTQVADVSGQATDQDALRGLLDLGASAEVLEFFNRLEVHDGYFQSGHVRLRSAADTLESNRRETPGMHIHRHGYVVVAQSEYGEAYAVATNDSERAGQVWVFSPEEDYDNVDRDSLAQIGRPVAKTFLDFLRKFMNGTVPADAPKRRAKKIKPDWYER